MELFVWTTTLALAAGLMGTLTLIGFIVIERRDARGENETQTEPEDHESTSNQDEDEPA